MEQPTEILKERYEVIKVLGEGALGRTMLAHDTKRGREPVAVKELLPSRMKRWKDLDLFHRECRTLENLAHRGIPTYFEDFVIESEEDGPPRLFLVQEFIDGKSLQDMLDDGVEFDEAKVRDIARQTLEILKYLHELNPPVVHRDLKPANLMMTEEGRVVLIDFGAVREAITFDGVGSTIVGTFGYMPPEQYAGKSVAATDLFALGATCVQLLSGRPPSELFEGLHHFKVPSNLPVTLGFERMLLKLTEPELDDRYVTAAEVLEDLDHQFLMVPKESIVSELPIPHEIIPGPRGYPGFHLRDAYHGRSHLGMFLISLLATFISGAMTIGAAMSTQPAFAIIGVFVLLLSGALAALVIKRANNEINVYRQGIYTLGEVTGRFWSQSNEISNLTYRYRVGKGFQYGCVSTQDKAYRNLAPGDPLGVIYLPNEPTEHVMYAVPTRWAKEQSAGQSKRLSSDRDADVKALEGD